MIIDGKQIAAEIIAELKKKPKPKKFFAAFLVGNDFASASFLNQKKKIAEELGIDFRLYKFPEAVSQDELRKEVLKTAEHKNCGGVIVQLPLPASISAQYVLNVIPRDKDVDVLGERALGAFYAGRNSVLPPAVGVVEIVLQTTHHSLQTSAVAVLGAGALVGKPIAAWLTGKCKEVFILDKGNDLSTLKNADVVICGAGVSGLVKPEMLKENALVIDFGYRLKDGKPSGDFDSSGLLTTHYSLQTISYTPTPGGTGPILVAKLFENFFTLLRPKD